MCLEEKQYLRLRFAVR